VHGFTRECLVSTPGNLDTNGIDDASGVIHDDRVAVGDRLIDAPVSVRPVAFRQQGQSRRQKDRRRSRRKPCVLEFSDICGVVRTAERELPVNDIQGRQRSEESTDGLRADSPLEQE
jgi:hypothetical protein